MAVQAAYQPPDGPLNSDDAWWHAKHVTQAWTHPIWTLRSGQLGELISTVFATDHRRVRARLADAEDLSQALYQSLTFARDVHRALNPEGGRLVATVRPPVTTNPEPSDRRTIERVWYHLDAHQHSATGGIRPSRAVRATSHQRATRRPR